MIAVFITELVILFKHVIIIISPKKSLFNLIDSSLSHHVNGASRKSLDIQAYSITKPRTLLKRKFV